MNKLYPILISLIFLFYTDHIYAQVSSGGKPYSFTHTDSTSFRTRSAINNSVKIKDLDYNQIKNEIAGYKKDCKDCNTGFYYGKEVDANIDFFEQADLVAKAENKNIWVLKLESEKAEGYQFIFSKFNIPEKGELFIYNEDKSMLLGAFTSANNRDDNTFLTQYINGNIVYVEYIEPIGAKSEIYLEKLVYIFEKNFREDKGPFSDGNGAASCQINTSCPEGKGYDIEIKSTVIILEKKSFLGSDYWGICSGALINDGNNYQIRKNPLLFSSNHCYEDKDNKLSDINNWVFLFRHEGLFCNSNGSEIGKSTTKSALGARVIARDVGSKSNDFLLLELKNTIDDIAKFDIAYAGYDMHSWFVEPGNFLSPLTNIHHPKGDIKKISISEKPAVSTGWNKAGDDHWDVTMTKGFSSEPGSSGSPLFDANHKVIGVCHGGDITVTCTSNRNSFITCFGKLSVAPKIAPSIFSYLPYYDSEPYIYVPDKPSGPSSTFTFMFTTWSTIDGDARIRTNSNLRVEASVSNLPKVDENIQWKLVISKYPGYSASNFECTDTDMYYCRTGYSKATSSRTASYSFFSLFDANPFSFKYKGSYSAKLEVSTESSGYKELLINKIIDFSVLENGYTVPSECFQLGYEIFEPKKKYAAGDKLWIQEKIKVLDSGSLKGRGECFDEFLNVQRCSGSSRIYYPRFDGVGSLYFYMDNTEMIKEEYTATSKYLDKVPGSYYSPKGFRGFSLSTPGLHTIKIESHPGKYTSWKYEDQGCKRAYPEYSFGSTSWGTVASEVIIVANCDGSYKGSSLSPNYLSEQRNTLKEIGLGTIEVNNLVLTSGAYHLEAYKKIVFGPGTHIKNGTSIKAEIVQCPSKTPTPTKEASTLKSVEISDPEIIIFPNPTSGIVSIKKQEDLEIYDMAGKLVKSTKEIINPYATDISNFVNGIYILKVHSNQGVSSHKIMLKK